MYLDCATLLFAGFLGHFTFISAIKCCIVLLFSVLVQHQHSTAPAINAERFPFVPFVCLSTELNAFIAFLLQNYYVYNSPLLLVTASQLHKPSLLISWHYISQINHKFSFHLFTSWTSIRSMWKSQTDLSTYLAPIYSD